MLDVVGHATTEHLTEASGAAGAPGAGLWGGRALGGHPLGPARGRGRPH